MPVGEWLIALVAVAAIIILSIVAVFVICQYWKKKRIESGRQKSATWPNEMKETYKDPGKKEQGKGENDSNQLEYV